LRCLAVIGQRVAVRLTGKCCYFIPVVEIFLGDIFFDDMVNEADLLVTIINEEFIEMLLFTLGYIVNRDCFLLRFIHVFTNFLMV